MAPEIVIIWGLVAPELADKIIEPGKDISFVYGINRGDSVCFYNSGPNAEGVKADVVFVPGTYQPQAITFRMSRNFKACEKPIS